MHGRYTKRRLTSAPSEFGVVGGPGGVRESQAPAGDVRLSQVPLVVADRPPRAQVVDLDVAFARRLAAHQPHHALLHLPDLATHRSSPGGPVSGHALRYQRKKGPHQEGEAQVHVCLGQCSTA